jgi:hypothetical protein
MSTSRTTATRASAHVVIVGPGAMAVFPTLSDQSGGESGDSGPPRLWVGPVLGQAQIAAGRPKPCRASGVRKVVISSICAPRSVSRLTPCGTNACASSSQT